VTEVPSRIYPPGTHLGGTFQASPEDFSVTEILPFPPDGEGEHYWLEVEKIGRNTEEVARLLARFAGVAARDVGYAGLKDRHARTRQVFTLPIPAKGVDWGGYTQPGLRILAVHRHRRKLRRGVHRGNRFVLRVRNLDVDVSSLTLALQQLESRGFPNYFGGQRFGYQNLDAAGRMLCGPRAGRMPHHLRAMLWSTARAALFNVVLAERVRMDNWQKILPGELVQLAGSHSHFCAQGDDAPVSLAARLAAWDLHPTGPLAGKGDIQPMDEAAELEDRILAQWFGGEDSPGNGLAWQAALARQGLDGARRALRCRPLELLVQPENEHTLQLAFVLPPGAYATVLLESLGITVGSGGNGACIP